MDFEIDEDVCWDNPSKQCDRVLRQRKALSQGKQVGTTGTVMGLAGQALPKAKGPAT